MSNKYSALLRYSPVLTYSDSKNDEFIEPDGTSRGELNGDTQALFLIGKEAYTLLTDGEKTEVSEFEDGRRAYFMARGEYRQLITEMQQEGKLQVQSKTRPDDDIEIDTFDDDQIIAMAWQMVATAEKRGLLNLEVRAVIREFYLFHALQEIDHALLGMDLGGNDAVAAAVAASNALSNAIAIESGSAKEQEIRSAMAVRAVNAKLKKDPKQVAKGKVKEHWKEWQQDPELYGSKAAFARDMVDAYDALTSTKKVEDWCRLWEAEHSPSQ